MDDQPDQFEQAVLIHLDRAYNLARWLTRNRDDAADAVQEALVRALKYFSGFRGGDSLAWFLTIVRNSSYSLIQRRGRHAEAPLPDDGPAAPSEERTNPETVALRSAHRERIHRAVQELPIEFREVIVLRELEGLSYKEISTVSGVPIGTVMSRLARGRDRLQQALEEFRNVL